MGGDRSIANLRRWLLGVGKPAHGGHERNTSTEDGGEQPEQKRARDIFGRLSGRYVRRGLSVLYHLSTHATSLSMRRES
jgi:hypothetical protein